jgi:hypothetical protein
MGIEHVQIMATMSMMKKALHMGTMEAERAARIFLEAWSRPKRRETRRARRERTMVTGMLSMGPRTTRDMATTTKSKTDQLLEKKSENQWEKRLMQSSSVKMMVKPRLMVSSVCLRGVSEPSALASCSLWSCASAMVIPKFCSGHSVRRRYCEQARAGKTCAPP